MAPTVPWIERIVDRLVELLSLDEIQDDRWFAPSVQIGEPGASAIGNGAQLWITGWDLLPQTPDTLGSSLQSAVFSVLCLAPAESAESRDRFLAVARLEHDVARVLHGGVGGSNALLRTTYDDLGTVDLLTTPLLLSSATVAGGPVGALVPVSALLTIQVQYQRVYGEGL